MKIGGGDDEGRSVGVILMSRYNSDRLLCESPSQEVCFALLPRHE